MIAQITGELAFKSLEYLVIDVSGIGYQVFVPLSTFYKIPDPPAKVSLQIHTHVRENALLLYGFLSREEKKMFELLIDISGIGPKMAINILSGIAVEEFKTAVSEKDHLRLTAVPGIGKKTAERIIIELRDKLGAITPEDFSGKKERSGVTEDALSALINLGYNAAKVGEVLHRVKQKNESLTVEDLIKESLKMLAKIK